MSGRMMFPLNAGVDGETEVTATYTDKNGSNAKEKAFKNVSVNPTLYTVGLEDETNYLSSSAPSSSIIFTEIRTAPRKGGTIQVRIMTGTNKENTPSFKIKIYDKLFPDGNTNIKATYDFSNQPADRIGIDIDNYDYFVILNWNIVDKKDGLGSSQDNVRAHFAKIKRIVSFDEFGDGIEFSPKYNGEIPEGTTFEIYRGAAKTGTVDTNLVAVSYGLRGDALATTDKYDMICNVNTPTFHFYNDRLQEKNQLDYNTKYTVTTKRFFDGGASSTISTSVINAHNLYESGSSNTQIEFSGNITSWNKLTEGMSLFTSNDTYIGNIESLGHNGGAIENRIYYARLDFARVAIQSSTNTNLKIGTTIQNVVFKTEKKYNNTIQNIGRNLLDATLVDNTLSADESDNNFNPIFWHTAFPLMRRSTTDWYSMTGTIWDKSSDLKGATTYINFKSASLKNDKVPTTLDTIVNNPKNKMSKMATVVSLDNSGTQHLKVKENFKMIVRNGLFSDSMKLKKIEHNVSSSSNTITINGLTGEYDYASILSDNTILEIDGYHYVVASVTARNYTLTTQTFTVDARKTVNSSVFVNGATVHAFTNADCYVVPYSNNKLNVEFSADTKIRNDQNNRLTLEDKTIELENTKLYNARISITNRRGHDIRINYGDRVHKYLTILDDSKQYYQKTPISRMYYYNGSFTINQEIFNGNVEDIESKNENGMMTYTISGRDEMAKLLSNTVNKNLNFSDDIVYSTLNPHIDDITSYHNSRGTTVKDTTNIIEVDGLQTFTKYTLFFNSFYELLGEYSSSSNSGDNSLVSGSEKTIITLKDKAYASIADNTNIYYYNPLDTSSRFISGVKAISTNILEEERTTDFSSVSEKGLVFNKGINYTYNTSTEEFSYHNVSLSSNEGDFQNNDSFGFDIINPSKINKYRLNGGSTNTTIETTSSRYLLRIGKEKETSRTLTNKDILSSEMFHVVNINEINDTKNVVQIAPNFPVVLGVQDRNTYGSRFLSVANDTPDDHNNLYFLNSNMPLGGFIHKLKKQFQHYYAPEHTIRYTDLQQFDNSTITPNDYVNGDPVYNDSNREFKIKGYTSGVMLFADGVRDLNTNKTTSLNENVDSQIGVAWYKRADNTINIDETVSTANIKKLVNNDWRARPYSFYATGDLFPFSKLRFNNLGFSDSNKIENFGVMFEGINGLSKTKTNHDYNGQTFSTKREDENYEISEISKSSLDNPTQIKRWGVIRLVEATFDWHFNSVDAESAYSLNASPRINIPIYRKWWNPSVGQTDYDNYDLYSQIGNKIDLLTKDNIAANNTVIPQLVLSRIYMASPSFESPYFNFSLLSGNSNEYNPPNILLPLISNVSESDVSGADYFINSAFHLERIAGATNDNNNNLTFQKYHISKVLSALCKPHLDNHTGQTINQRPYNIAWPSSDIYENCTAIFKDMTSSREGSDTTMEFTSSPLKSDSFTNLASTVAGRLGLDQHTSNIMNIKGSNYAGTSNNLSFIGTKTASYPFSYREGHTPTTDRKTNHHLADNAVYVDGSPLPYNSKNDGELYSAQMFIKPQFNITSDVAMGNDITFIMNTSSTHHWLNFVPNLEGFYIVSSKLIDNQSLPNNTTRHKIGGAGSTVGSTHYIILEDSSSLPATGTGSILGTSFTWTANNTSTNTLTVNIQLVLPIGTEVLMLGDVIEKGTPVYIGKILTHEVDETGTYDTHKLTFDKSIDISEHGNYFRLMRISDTVFEDTANYFEINVMQDKGLQYNKIISNFLTGDTSIKNQYSEGIYSMYMLLNIDEDITGNNYLDRRDLSTISSSLFTNGDEMKCYITDGLNSQSKSLSVSYVGTGTGQKLRFDYNGTLNGDGCVSFGEILDINVPRKLSFKPSKCYIGTTFSIGGIIENEIENIANEVGLDFDYEKSFRNYTDNVVDAEIVNNVLVSKITHNANNQNVVTSSVLTTVDSPINVVAGDVLYTQKGYLIGEVTSVSSTTITFNDMIFDPLPFDEIIKRERKTHVSNINFNDTNAFDAINLLASKKGLDFKITNNELVAKDIEDTHGLRRYSISYKTGHNLISVESNKSLFDKANKIIVIGDGVKAESEIPIDDRNSRNRTIRHVDSSIKSILDAKIKSQQLLQIHNADIRKIKLKIQKEGLELMEAGDILILDFPNHNIPKNEYQVFEIENILDGISSITVGTFNKTIAERLSELTNKQTSNSSVLFGKNSIQSVVGKTVFDSFLVKNGTIEYKIVSSTGNLGFSNPLGFTTILGFGAGSTTLKTYKSEKDV